MPLTGLSLGAQNGRMSTDNKGRVNRKKKVPSEKPPPRLNQFGEPMAMAIAIQTVVTAYECTECGALSFGTSGKMPFRCSNRKSCGKPFHGVINEQEQ